MKQRIRKIASRVSLFIVGTLITVILAYAWGATAHHFLNLKAAANLPAFMGWFKADSIFFQDHASDPDIRRDNNDTTFHSEQYRHYIDIDAYPNFHSIPHNLDSCIMLYGYQTVKTIGLNPWATTWVLDSLTAQLARGDTNSAKQTAADLGHYVADAHQPLHAAANYDGQYTGNGGIHSRYETTMINNFQSSLAVHTDSIHYIPAPLDYAFDYLYHTNSLVDSVLAGDNYAKAVSGWNGNGSAPTSYYNALWAFTKNFTLDQFQRATVAIASLWYTAWVNAGSPLFTLQPDSMDFGSVPLGQSRLDSITISNTGFKPLIISSIVSNDSVFTVSASSDVIPAGGSQKFYITFTPVDGNARSDTLTFLHNAPGSPGKIIVRGVGLFSSFFVSQPDSLNFGAVLVGQIKQDSIILSNGGFDTLKVYSISSSDPVFSFSTASDVIPPGGSHKLFVMFTPVDGNSRLDTLTFVHNAPGSPGRIVVRGNGLFSLVQVSLYARWNLVSNPVRTSNDSVRQVFPPVLSAYAYTFRPDSGYVQRWRMANGVGYWAKFASAQTATIAGVLLASDTIDVNTGWNLVGSISDSVASSSVVALGTTIQSPFYGYDNGYHISGVVETGKGYWVKVGTPGRLVFSSDVITPGTSKSRFVSEPLNALSSLEIVDVEGHRQMLYFGPVDSKEGVSSQYELPPVPPSGMFDVRFASQRMVESPEDGKDKDVAIQVSSAAYPLMLQWTIRPFSISGSLMVDGKTIPMTRSEETEVVNANARILLHLSWDPSAELPQQFALSQNYPNPFNPSTEIRYALPEDATVNLNIYNLLGQVVSTLVEGTQRAGYHRVRWDAGEGTSGIYFYRLDAQSTSGQKRFFSDVKKMILIR